MRFSLKPVASDLQSGDCVTLHHRVEADDNFDLKKKSNAFETSFLPGGNNIWPVSQVVV